MSAFKNIIPDTGIDFAKYYADSEGKTHVIPAGAFVDEIVERFKGGATLQGDPFPYPKLRDVFSFRPKETTVWYGYKGHTKSSELSDVFSNFMGMGRRCLAISPEFAPLELLARTVKQCAASACPDERYIRKWGPWANDRLWVFDKQSKLSPDLVLGVVAYGIKELGINHVVVDSLMKCGIAPDDYGRQKDFMDRLQHLSHSSDDTHLHIVMHARKGADDFTPPTMHDVKGTSELVDMAENVICVHMDKKKQIARSMNGGVADNSQPDITLTIEAQRNHPNGIGRFGLYFAPGLRFAEQHNAIPAPYFDAGRGEF